MTSRMHRGWFARSIIGLATWTAGACTGQDITDQVAAIPERPAYNEWIKIEPEGAVCGNGSQYKFFVNYSEVSNNLVVAFEPGGACWDYDSCTGQNGVRGAANVDGIPDSHMDVGGRIVPFFQREYDDNYTRDWNMVYVPYCTGDVHSGNAEVVYQDASGTDQITFHHAGHSNTVKVIEWMAEQFETIPQFLATGCSAGGAGATINYYYLRQGLPGIQRGYLLADSGPIMPSDGFSGPLHDKVYEAWRPDSYLDELPGGFDPDNFGSVNTALADQYPDDRLAVTMFQRDYNYSLYSYERFYDLPDPEDPQFKEEILTMWRADMDDLMDVYDTRDNLAYFMPYWRALNDSHCTTLISYAGSDIEDQGATLEQFVADLFDDSVPLESYLETPQPGEDP